MDDERAHLRPMVLGDGSRRTGCALAARSSGSGLSLSADGDAGMRVAALEPGIRGLPVPRVHQRHGVQPHRHAAVDSLGEDADARAGVGFLAHRGLRGGPRGEYLGLISSVPY